MQDEMKPRSLSTKYTPVAVYYEEADLVEYVRKDVPSVCRRIDGLLTLVFNMKDRSELIGFRLKGFKNYYLRNLNGLDDFVSLVHVLEHEMTKVGNAAFERREAYKKAREIADVDQVKLADLPLRMAVN